MHFLKSNCDKAKPFVLLLMLVVTCVLCVPRSACAADADSDDDGVITVSLDVTYCQTDARSMLELVNELRTGDDAWYWDSTDTEQIYVSGLGELEWDYALEEIAMQRAAEIAISFSHTRPNGTSRSTAYSEYSYVWGASGENLAAGYITALEAFNGLAEADKSYSGQGHRRIMLGSSYNRIAIACVCYNGIYYWVMEAAASTTDNIETAAYDGTKTMSVDISIDNITALVFGDADALSLCTSNTLSIPTTRLITTNTWPSSSYRPVTIDSSQFTWSSEDGSIATVDESGVVTMVSPGTTTITASLTSDYSVSYTVTFAHNYASEITSPATCASTGTLTYTCSDCGDSYTEDIAKADHAYTSAVTKESTCAEEGTLTYTCSACGDAYTESIALADHTAVTDAAVAATCTSTGLTEGSHCSVCNKILVAQETVEKTAHSYVGTVQTAATCTSIGTMLYTCSDCGDSYAEDIAKIDHVYTSAVTKGSTCAEEGTLIYTCSACGDTYTESIALADHTVVTDAAVAATCTSTGLTAGSHCSVCGEVIVAQEVVAKTAHTTKTTTTTTKATTSSAGKIVAATTCTTCGVTTSTKTTTIAKIKSATLGTSSYTYDGSAKKPSVTVVDSDGNTISSSYYTVAYSNNKNAGTATATITFKGNYSGTITKTFTINAKSLSSATVTLSASSYTYNGSAKKPTPTVVLSSTTLTKGTDYTVSYSNNKNAGTATVTITGTGNYKGTVSKTFTIKKASQTITYSVGTKTLYTGSSGKTCTTITASTSGTGKLTYTSSDTSIATVSSSGKITAKGTGTVKITIKAAATTNYKAATKTFTVKVKTLSKPTVSSLTNKTGLKMKLAWKKVSAATGYQIQYSTSKTFSSKTTVKITKNTTLSKTITGLTKGKTYYVRIRSYKTLGGATVYSAWSTVKSVKVTK